MMRREFQLFLLGYIIVSLCEIFTVGGFPLDRKVRLVWLPPSLCLSCALTDLGFHCGTSGLNRGNALGFTAEWRHWLPASR